MHERDAHFNCVVDAVEELPRALHYAIPGGLLSIKGGIAPLLLKL
jgi:hypothetical protein